MPPSGVPGRSPYEEEPAEEDDDEEIDRRHREMCAQYDSRALQRTGYDVRRQQQMQQDTQFDYNVRTR